MRIGNFNLIEVGARNLLFLPSALFLTRTRLTHVLLRRTQR